MIRRIAMGWLLVVLVGSGWWFAHAAIPTPAARAIASAIERFKAGFAQQAGRAWHELEQIAVNARDNIAGGLASARCSVQPGEASGHTRLPTPLLAEETILDLPGPIVVQPDRAEHQTEILN